MIIVIILGWLLIRSSRFQTWAVNRLADKVEQKFGGSLQVGEILVRFPKTLLAKDVLIRDQLGDTLCFVPEIKAGIKELSFENSTFKLTRIKISDPYIQLLEDPGGGNNFDFVLEMLAPKDSLSSPIYIQSDQIQVKNTRLKFRKFGVYSLHNVFTPNNFELSGMDLNLKQFKLDPDSISFSLNSFRFDESSGFALKDMVGDFAIVGNRVEADGLELITDKSILNIPLAEIEIPGNDSANSFLKGLEIKLSLADNSVIDPEDIRFFYPEVDPSYDRINLVGDVRINPDSWRLNNARMAIGDWFGFNGDLLVNGPEDLLRAGYNTTVDTLWLDVEQARNSYVSLFVDLDTVDLPFNHELIGNLYFKGSMRGAINDFDAEGDLKSGAGTFTGNISIHPGMDPEVLNIFSRYRVSLIHMDNILDLSTGIGLISADGSIEGTWDGDTVYSLKGETILPFIQWNDYYYSNVNVKSIIQNKLYEAAIFVDDEFGKLDFAGKINLREEEPIFDFDVTIGQADLAALNLYPPDSVAFLDLNMHASFSGTEIDDIEGHLWVEDSKFSNSRGEIPVKELSLEVGQEFNRKKINLVSEYIDGRMIGDIYLDDLFGQISEIGDKFLPFKMDSKVIHEDRINDFIFNIHFKNPRPLTDVLASNLVFKENTKLNGFFNYGNKELQILGTSPQFLISRNQFTDLTFKINASGEDLDVSIDLEKIQLDQTNVFKHIKLNAILLPEVMEASLEWQGEDSTKYLSDLDFSVVFEPGEKTLPRVIVDIPNSTIFFREKQWEVSDSKFEIDNRFFKVDNLMLSNHNEEVMIDGVVSDEPTDTLSLVFNNLDIGLINQLSGKDGFKLSGLIEGETKIFNFYDGGLFLADLLINDFVVNGEKIGLTEVRSQRADNGSDIMINVLTKRGDISTLQMDGRYSPNTDNLDFVFKLDKLRLSMFDPFLSPVLSEVNGIATGDVNITGTRQIPVLDGLINVQKGSLRVDYLNTRYTFTHPVIVKNNAFVVENLTARDSLGNKAIVNGGIMHKNFADLSLDFRVKGTDFLFMDTEEIHGNGYWGTAFGTGDVRIFGPFGNIGIDVLARTSAGTQFSIPVTDQGDARAMDFITYVIHEQPDDDPDLISFDSDIKQTGYNVKQKDLQLHLDIDITPEAEALIIFDAQVGDVMRGRGTGNLQMDINSLGLFTLNGGFNIDEGEYLFTLQNMPIKRFAIVQGSTINFTGQIEEAQLDIDAIYNTKAALYDLILEEGDGLTERIPVSCHLFMQGMLESPDITFSINLPPNSDDVARSQLESLTKDELNKQLFSLLILNRFQPLPGLNSSYSTRSYGNAGLATTTDVLSSQLNYWLSQISNDFDIGFNYRPGDQITSDEVEVALSTQIFNDRMTINLNGNVDMRSSQGETNQLVGDVEVEYKIKPSGRVRVKAFNRSNDMLIYEYSPYTQGLGLFFREEFDTMGELYRKYWNSILGRQKTGKK